MARQGLMDDSGYDFFDVSDCSNYESCREDAYNDGYEKGRADYEAECQKIFEDNPPMHFNHEQIMWLKEFVKIRCNQARADVIDEVFCLAKENAYDDGVDYSISLQVLDELIEQLKGKRQ